MVVLTILQEALITLKMIGVTNFREDLDGN